MHIIQIKKLDLFLSYPIKIMIVKICLKLNTKQKVENQLKILTNNCFIFMLKIRK